MKISHGEALLAAQLDAAGIAYEREVRFHPSRRWRWDFVIVTASKYFADEKLAVEIDGGAFSRGTSGHRSGVGMTSNCEKVSHGAIAGWRVIRATTEQVKSGQALQWIQAALQWEASD